jgi:hypothetical protein
MASASINDIKNVIRYAKISSQNLAAVEAAFASAMVEINSNLGGNLVSGSTNGSTFTTDRSMTISQFATMLRIALEHIEAGTMPQSRTIARLS